MAEAYLHERREYKYIELMCKADAWAHARRVILVIRPRPESCLMGIIF